MRILRQCRETRRPLILPGWLLWSRKYRWLIAVVGVAFMGSLAIVLLTSQLGSVFFQAKPSEFELGTVAKRDFIVEKEIVFVDEKATAVKRDAIGKLAPPVFQVNEEIALKALEDLDSFREVFLENSGSDIGEQQFYLKLQSAVPGVISTEGFRQEDFRLLLTHANPEGIFATSRLLIEEVMGMGVVGLPDEVSVLTTSEALEIRRWKDGKLESEVVPLESAVTVQDLADWTDHKLSLLSLDALTARLVALIVLALSDDDTFYDRVQTAKKREKLRSDVEPVLEKLHEGQIIVRKGDVITEDALSRIRAIGEYSISVNVNAITGSSLFLLMVFVLSLYLTNHQWIGVDLSKKYILFLLGMGLFYLVLSASLVKIVSVPDWLPFSVVLPTGAAAILVAILISTPAGILCSLLMAFLLLLVTKMNIFAFVFALLSGIAGTAVVQRTHKRIDLVRAGLYLSVLNSAALVTLGFFLNYDPGEFLIACGWGIANGFLCGVSTLGFLPILEHTMNAPTRFVLMELSDLNAPVLKRMLSFAPGTYNHAINVANLAESACTEIGANALLARVGAYYHDIGKTDQADYFVENQQSTNKHDELKPRLSAAVIKSHVKMGVEKAKELRLPQEVIDIIAQHHGKALILYFYQRAVDNGGNGKVSRDDYSYAGTRPRSKEAAVVMLADAVEAASRTLKKPTLSKVEKFVWNLILEKFNTAELSESTLTLKDLEVIKSSFVQVLSGRFHSRIEYPKAVEAVR